MDPKKKKLFIGSSSEALSITSKLNNILQERYEVTQWNNAFTINHSTLDCLMEIAFKTDYAIFIGTPDDYTLAVNKTRARREGCKQKHRDNVIFEFGLFLGTLGRGNCIYLIAEGSSVLSDFQGITTIYFNQNNLEKSLKDASLKIIEHFNNQPIHITNVSPSCSLAFVYFTNFIKPIFNHYISNQNKIITDKQTYNSCELRIIIPDSIPEDMNAFIQLSQKELKYKHASIQCLGRPRQLMIIDTPTNTSVHIIDKPTILVSLHHTIQNLFPQIKQNNAAEYERIITREVHRFSETLKMLIKQDCTSQYIPVKIHLL